MSGSASTPHACGVTWIKGPTFVDTVLNDITRGAPHAEYESNARLIDGYGPAAVPAFSASALPPAAVLPDESDDVAAAAVEVFPDAAVEVLQDSEHLGPRRELHPATVVLLHLPPGPSVAVHAADYATICFSCANVIMGNWLGRHA